MVQTSQKMQSWRSIREGRALWTLTCKSPCLCLPVEEKAKAECLSGSLLKIYWAPSVCSSCVPFVCLVDEPIRLVLPLSLSASSSNELMLQLLHFFSQILCLSQQWRWEQWPRPLVSAAETFLSKVGTFLFLIFCFCCCWYWHRVSVLVLVLVLDSPLLSFTALLCDVFVPSWLFPPACSKTELRLFWADDLAAAYLFSHSLPSRPPSLCVLLTMWEHRVAALCPPGSLTSPTVSVSVSTKVERRVEHFVEWQECMKWGTREEKKMLYLLKCFESQNSENKIPFLKLFKFGN